MKINYVENKNGKLFSFNRHDYHSDKDDEGNFVMIDGGFSYIRYSGELKSDEVSNLIGEIRNKFIWGSIFDESGNLRDEVVYNKLKDLETNHIYNILKYFTETLHEDDLLTIEWKITHLIFIEELIYRTNTKTNE
jgi:hypothetical protein